MAGVLYSTDLLIRETILEKGCTENTFLTCFDSSERFGKKMAVDNYSFNCSHSSESELERKRRPIIPFALVLIPLSDLERKWRDFSTLLIFLLGGLNWREKVICDHSRWKTLWHQFLVP